MKLKSICRIAVLCALTLPGSLGLALPPPDAPPLPHPPYAIVTYYPADLTGQAVSVVSPCVNGIFALVGLVPDQVVQITIQYPTSQALQTVNLAALDGGVILPPTNIQTAGTAPFPPAVGQILQNVPPLLRQVLQNMQSIPVPAPDVLSLAISVDGTLTFTFIATHDPGKNQISLQQSSQELGLQFWVFDSLDPQANPPAITASNPYPAAAD